MKQIVRNGKIISFDRIVSYGCSFTEGSELMDHEVLGMTADEADALKRKISNTEFFNRYIVSKGSEFVDSLLYQQTKRAWAAKLANKFEVDYECRAVAGASLQFSQFRIEEDIAASTIRETDLVLVGLTSPDRWLWIDDKGKPARTMFRYNIEHWPSKSFYKSFVSILNDNFILYNYFSTLKYLDLLSASLGDKVMLVYCHAPLNMYQHWYKVTNNIQSMINQALTFKSIIDHDLSLCQMHGWEDPEHVHGGLHPKEHVHEEFTDIVYKRLTT